jgi:hypothetical protein
MVHNTRRDKGLRKLARQIVTFQRNLAAYIIVNVILWIIWWFTTDDRSLTGGTPWPAWVMLAWGLILLFQFFEAYGNSQEKLVNKENGTSK